MTTPLVAGIYVVVRSIAAADKRVAIADLAVLAGTASENDGVIVLGPMHSATGLLEALALRGLTYPDDYFDCDESGGTFPLWCMISVGLRR